jgi:hypothetical protein
MIALEKKALESRVIHAAQCAGFPLPTGELVEREEPDFEVRSDRGTVGIELSVVLPPPRHASFNSPLAEEDFYEKAIRQAETEYSNIPGALPVTVSAYPWQTARERGKHRKMARELVAFVSAHAHEAKQVALFDRRDQLPEGYGVINIVAEPGRWDAGGSGSFTVDHIYGELTERITAKNALVPAYRRNLPGSQIWLLLYCGAAVSDGIQIPYGIEQWSTPFDFDCVFFFSALSGSVVEIGKATSEREPAESSRTLT